VKLQQYCIPLGLLYTKFTVFLSSTKLCCSDRGAACGIYPLSQRCETHRSLRHTLHITHTTYKSIRLLGRLFCWKIGNIFKVRKKSCPIPTGKFGPKMEKITEAWRKFNKEIPDMNYLPNIIRVTGPRTMIRGVM